MKVGRGKVFNILPSVNFLIWGSDYDYSPGSGVIMVNFMLWHLNIYFDLPSKQREQFYFMSPALWYESGKLEFGTKIDFRADNTRSRGWGDG